MIEVNGLTKRYGSVPAVDDLSFAARPGVVTGFLGPNGAGKSTTLRAILGLVHPSAGTATVLGKPYRSLDRPTQRVGAVLEATAVHPGRSGRDHLRIVAAAAALPRSRVDDVLSEVDLVGASRRRVGGYSLGMRQRLALAVALLGDPDVMILDEPANGLDPQGIAWLRELLRAQAASGKTILISSHVLSEVEQTVDEVVIIHRGRLVRQAPIHELAALAVAGTRIRTPDAARLAAALSEDGIDATAAADGTFVTAAPPERVGEIAAAHGIVLHELTVQRASLEDVFLELTSEPPS